MMKKITLLLLLLTVSFGYAQTSNYCSTEIYHFDNPAETDSAINLTIVNTGATTMKVTAANDVDLLELQGITGAPIVSAPDTSVPGEISITLSWAPAAPVDVTFTNILWSKTTFGGNWMISNVTTPSAGNCTIIPPAEDATLSDLTVDGTSVTGFSSGTLTYNVELPYGTTAVPTVVGTPTQGTASAVTTNAGSLPGATTVLVTAQDNSFTKTYTLNFTVAATPPVTLPFNFSSANQLFTGVGGAAASLTTDPDDVNNDVLQIVGPVADWDNSEIAFTTPVDLSNSATNSISFKIRTAGDYGTRKHLFKFLGGTAGGTDIELFFELDAGTGWQTVSLDADDAPQFNGTAANFQKLLIFTDAGDGNTGTYYFDDISAPEAAPETCSDGIQNQDETGIDCGGTFCAPCDLTAPTGFTATVGTIGAFSVELLLNATDDSGSVTYNVTDGAIAETTAASGATTLVISGLTPETAYSFDVTASDASGNINSTTITLPATTIADTSTACAGFSTEALEGTFSVGYNYSFVTSGTDVTVTFEILDTDKPGLNPQIFVEPSTFLNMDNSGAPTYTYTFTGQTPNDVISFSLRAAYEGGLVRSKIFSYTVGDDCGTLSIKDYEIEGLAAYPNPTNSKWTISTKNQEIQAIEVFNVIGKRVLSVKPNALSAKVDASSLAPGIYIATITTEKGTSSRKLIKN